MKANFHTHTVFSDGKNTPEELVLYAIENGMVSLGFSDHALTEHDTRYCLQDVSGYIREIKRLKQKYADKIQIYLGVEEDGTQLVNRSDFDYIIGSLHYIEFAGKYYPLDSNYEYFSECLKLFNGDAYALAEAYYTQFCAYLQARQPDLVGHFDLVCKFDETEKGKYLHDECYWALAEESVKKVLETGCIFEVNTGLMSRGYRTSPCPHERLLKLIAQYGGKVALSSDAHQADNVCARFTETEQLLKNVGFDGVYFLYDGKWQKRKI